MIRVFIVAASPLARAGLKSVLASRAIQVVGASADLDVAGDQFSDGSVDVILMGASGESSEALLDSLQASEVAADAPVMILSDQPGALWGSAILRAGVRAILPADLPQDQLLAALQAVAAGLVVVHPTEVSAALPAAVRSSIPVTELAEQLTPRELEVLQMLAGGLGNKEIAAKLSISEHTAKFHVASILGKLGVSTRTEAVSQAIRRGLVLL